MDRAGAAGYDVITMSAVAPIDTLTPPLSEIIRRIVATIDPDRIILFGSRARGDARPDSDYDLLVIKDTTERTLVLAQRAYRALIGVLGPADILVETPQRLAQLRNCPGLVYGDAMRDGRTLYERPSKR